MTVRRLRLAVALRPTGRPPWVVSVVVSVSVARQGASADGAQHSLSVTAASLEAGRPISASALARSPPCRAAAPGCGPSCRCSRRRRCSSPPRRTTPSRGRHSGLCRRLRAATPRRRSPTCPTSRSTAAPVSGPSCRRSSRRRRSSPPRRTTPSEVSVRVRAGVCGQRRLDAGRPRARRLAQQQTLLVARAVLVVADGGAVPRRGARHRAEAGGRVVWRLRAGTPRRRPPTSPPSRSIAAPRRRTRARSAA